MTGSEEPIQVPEVALILAAGLGSRLRPNEPRSLTRVFGLSLAERVMCTLRTAGIRRFVVTLGHEAEIVRAHFTDIASRRDLVVEFAQSEDWRSGNGSSVLSARELTGDAPFFLVMTDHLISPEIPRILARNVPRPEGVSLAVDHAKASFFDLDDVTRVRTRAGQVQEIGKDLKEWDAADTGVMLCTSGLFDALERAAAKSCHGLSDGLREMAADKQLTAIDVTGNAWVAVDTLAALSEAERQLMQAQNLKTTDGPVSRHLNRPISRRLTRYLVHTRLTPNQISFGSWVLSCVAAGLFAVGGYPALALGGLIAQFASIVDGCDGEVARLKHLQTDFGGWFDAILDRYADAFLLLGLTWHVFAATGSHSALLLGFAALAGSFMNSYSADKYDGLMARKLHGRSYLRLGRDIRVFVIFLGALLNLPLLTLTIIALVTNIEVVRRILVLSREKRPEAVSS